MNIKDIKNAYHFYGEPQKVAGEIERIAYIEGKLEKAEIYAFIIELLDRIERLENDQD